MKRYYQIRLVERKNKLKKRMMFDICLVYRTKKSGFVISKLGFYNKTACTLSVDVFKLIFWVSRNVKLTGNVVRLLEKNGIVNFSNDN